MRPNGDGSDEEVCPVGWAGTEGNCTKCLPGQEPTVDRAGCEDCGRYMYNPDGRGCRPCEDDEGSVPNAVTGGLFCVRCSLEGIAHTNQVEGTDLSGEVYAATDWDGLQLW